MILFWIAILVSYGLKAGWEKIDPLFWLLAIVMFFQDMYDYYVIRRDEEELEERVSQLEVR